MGLLRDSGEGQLLGRYSSFHSVEQTLSEIIELIMKSERLKRLLYYTDKQALSLPQIKPRQMMEILEQIHTVPKINLDPDGKPYIIIVLTDFAPETVESEYRDFVLRIDIVCPFNFWQLSDFKLRPYAIAGEIDALVNKSHINRNGIANFIGAKELVLNNEVGGLSLFYLVHTVGKDTMIHPEEKTEE